MYKLLVVAALIGCGGSNSHGPDAGDDVDAGTDAGPVVPGGDTTFGTGGLVTAGFPGGIAGVMRVARQPDGKIVGVGATEEALLIVRVDPDGSFDSSFAGGGVLQLPMGVATNGVMVGYGAVIQPDGKIVAAARVLGTYDGLVPVELVVRLLPDGTLDPAFAHGGMFVGARATGAQSLALDPAGNLVVGGFGHIDRLLPDGTLDPAFGTQGTAHVALNPIDLAVQPDGKIVAIGGKTIARFTSTGAVDASFATNGVATVTSAQSYDQLFTVALQADGTIVVGGAMTPTGAQYQDYWIGRFTPSGAPDATFGTAGVRAGTGTTGGVAYGVGVDAFGKIAGSGYFSIGGGMGRTARFDATGALDPTFGGGGVGPSDPYRIPFSNLVFEPDGTFTTAGAGLAPGSTGFQVALMRTTATGQADPTFGNGGSVMRAVGGSFDRAQAVAVQPDGKILVGGWAYTGGGAAIVRLEHDGSRDMAFGTAGQVIESRYLSYVNAIAVQPDGKILVSGLSGFAGSKRQFVVERYTPAGQPDATFGTMGVVSASVAPNLDATSMNMTVTPSGAIVLVGQTATASGTGNEYGVVELTADGAPLATAQTAFGGTSYGIATHAAAQPDGSVLVLGMVGSGPRLVRITPAGALDTAFAPITLPTIPQGMYPFGLAVQPDGGIVAVAGNYTTGDLEVVRYTAAGALDASFGTAGVFATKLRPNDYYGLYSFYGLALLPDGSLEVGCAAATADGLNETGVLLRLTAAGAPAGTQSIAIGRGSTSINALALDADGKLLVAGRTWTEAGSSDFMVLRLAL